MTVATAAKSSSSTPKSVSSKLSSSSLSSSSSSSPFTSWPRMILPEDESSSIQQQREGGLGFLGGVERDEFGRMVSIPAVMNYVSRSTKIISTRRNKSGSDGHLEGAQWEPTTVRVHNARLLQHQHPKKKGSCSGGSEKEKKELFSLFRHGFELRQSELGQKVLEESKLPHLENPSNAKHDYGGPIDFLDQKDVVQRYYPHCEALVKEALEAGDNGGKIAMVKAFDHNVRISQDDSSKSSSSSTTAVNCRSASTSPRKIKNSSSNATVQSPAGLVHADYTRISAPRRLEGLTQPPKANDVLKGMTMCDNDEDNNYVLVPATVKQALEGKRRYAFINVWRNIHPEQPVQQFPLACIDASSVTFDDLRKFQIHYADRIGENYFSCFSPRHHWYYFRGMLHNEALLIKQWDSHGALARGQDCDKCSDTTASSPSSFSVHSAFRDPTSCPNAPPRESIEVRCVVLWEEELEKEKK